MADVPHFAVPFRVTAGKVATVEQDSDGAELVKLELDRPLLLPTIH